MSVIAFIIFPLSPLSVSRCIVLFIVVIAWRRRLSPSSLRWMMDIGSDEPISPKIRTSVRPYFSVLRHAAAASWLCSTFYAGANLQQCLEGSNPLELSNYSRSSMFHAHGQINAWNFLPDIVDFSSLSRFKRSVHRVEISYMFLRCFYDMYFIFCTFGIFCAFCVSVFVFFKFRPQWEFEPDVSCSESMS